MKKLYSLIVILAVLMALPVAAFANAEAFLYKDRFTGVEFSVPANWTQEALSQEREFFDAKFTSDKDAGASILYGSTDIWAQMSSNDRSGFSRSDMNNSIFTLDEIAEAMGVTQSEVSKVTYGGSEYFEYVQETASSFSGIDYKTTITGLIRFENGYAYTFQFSGDKSTIRYKDFEALLSSVTYPSTENSSSYDGFSKFSASNVILCLLITITIYSVPIIIYRYGILKHPVERGKAKKIAIIYGVIAFIAMSVLIFAINGSGAADGAILLWSWVNYKVLTSGCEAQNECSAPQESPTAMSSMAPQNSEVANTVFVDMDSEHITKGEQASSGEDSIFFCYKCGTKLGENSRFCHKCGTKVSKL